MFALAILYLKNRTNKIATDFLVKITKKVQARWFGLSLGKCCFIAIIRFAKRMCALQHGGPGHCFEVMICGCSIWIPNFIGS